MLDSKDFIDAHVNALHQKNHSEVNAIVVMIEDSIKKLISSLNGNPNMASEFGEYTFTYVNYSDSKFSRDIKKWRAACEVINQMGFKLRVQYDDPDDSFGTSTSPGRFVVTLSTK
jgi:hypothetical protein